MIYRQFQISRFRGVVDATVSLTRGDLVLLLGLNESGKTTILHGLQAFDFRNDPPSDSFPSFLSSIRNKSDLFTNEPAVITADIEFSDQLTLKEFARAIHGISHGSERLQTFEDFLHHLNSAGSVRVSRIFPFKNGNPKDPRYRIHGDHAFLDDVAAATVAQRLVSLCPFILYFEDFTDRIPDRIYVAPSNSAYDPDWYDIVDGLFFHTAPLYSVDSFRRLYSRSNPRSDDANTVLRKVNKTLNRVFTRQWKALSGVRDIATTELIANNFGRRAPHFEIKVTDRDGTTFAVDERSKGALWYLSFLMKTEFRRKKMRRDSGKPIFLIDEPASNLHSTAQKNMLGDFRQLVEDTSVIYTTHSQYLVSLENIRNTYVITRREGVVRATKWGEYLKEDAPHESHYQPIANLLQLIPNSLDVPWATALITEGPSDRHVLLVMYEVLFEKEPDWVIYPGTSATSLRPLISLNLGWGSDFRVLLDADDAGKEAQKAYIQEFDLADSIVMLLPEDGKMIEGYFNDDEKRALCQIAFRQRYTTKVTKKQLQNAMSLLVEIGVPVTQISSVLTSETKERFRELFRSLRPPFDPR